MALRDACCLLLGSLLLLPCHRLGSELLRRRPPPGRGLVLHQVPPQEKCPMRVAYAIIAHKGVTRSRGWRDTFAVLARSLQKVASASRHRAEILALLPTDIADAEKEERALRRLGILARLVPVPVPLEEVQTAFARKELALVLGQYEQLKYYGAALAEYDRVVILDGDTMFLAPIDEVLEDNDDNTALLGVYDHGLDIPGSAFPPLNSGFLVYKPDPRDFQNLRDLVREGDLRPGTGWRGSRTGWTYGTGSQGVLSFYYNQVVPGQPAGYVPGQPKKGHELPGFPWTERPKSSRFRALDRSVYNVIVSDKSEEVLYSGKLNASRVKVFHYTGSCSKPFHCRQPDGPLCAEMVKRWWQVRAELARELGAKELDGCTGRGYPPLPL